MIMHACMAISACMRGPAQVERAKAENVPIRVVLPDGTAREGLGARRDDAAGHCEHAIA